MGGESEVLPPENQCHPKAASVSDGLHPRGCDTGASLAAAPGNPSATVAAEISDRAFSTFVL